MLEPSNIPPWIRKIYELGSGVSGYFEQKYREIEASESDRIRAGQTQRDSPYSLEQAQQRDHMRRNRYFDIIPFDGSRVILQEPSAPENSNYINASHVDGFPGTSKYITSQGPLGNTFGDFWQMVWEQNSRVIVMLTREEERGRTKCDRYWPDSTEQPLDFNNLGGLHLKLLEERSTSEGAVLIRRLHLSHSSHHQASPTTRELWQVHFLNWPDHRASSPYSVLGVMDLVRELQSRSESSGPVGPLVVHCSAGCGRTGTFCAIDTVLSLLEHYPGSDITAETSSLSTSPHSQELDPSTDLVYLSVEKFREARVSMVQTLEQYKFIYEAVVYRILEWQHEIEQNGEASRSRTRRPPWVKPGVGKQRI
ncbi:protein-tyrosine phosphatase-like protein [Phlyctochytrium arcticum]|nr:protein-tyrosine phosphatase-like protein [Phlyctochytrium arcticum]